MNWQRFNKVSSFSGETSGIVKKNFIITAALLSSLFLAAIVNLLYIADNLNNKADARSSLLLQKALTNRQEKIRANLMDNADWGEAYNNLHKQVNVKWAWDSQNLGESLYTNYQYEGVFVLSPAGETRYSVIEGNLVSQPFEKWLNRNITKELFNDLSQSQGKAVSRLMMTNGQLTLLAAARITSEDDESITPVAEDASVLIFADVLTPVKLEKMGNEYGIHNAHTFGRMEPHLKADYREAQLILPIDNGDVLIEWRSDDPGRALMNRELPLIIILMLSTIAFTWLMRRGALIKAQINDENVFLLEQSRQALTASERRFRDVIEATTDWIWEADSEARLTWLSDRFSGVTGHHSDDWLGRNMLDFIHSDKILFHHWLLNPQTSSNYTLKKARYFSAQGHQRYCNVVAKRAIMDDGSMGFRGTVTDVTLEVEAQERAEYLSRHDELTGLPNRVRMKEFLEGELRSLPDPDHPLAMISLDLDKFKPVNDLFGHNAGDALLNEVASRLRSCTRKIDLVARQGGDEFILILPDIYVRKDIETLCQRIASEISRPFIVNGNEVYISVSMGIALAPQDAMNACDLIRLSDIALYKAKNTGRNNWVFYDPNMGEYLIQRREMEKEFREALCTDQFQLVYQPRYDIKTSRIAAVEALVRWQHPRLGLLMPDQFIPLAEETGLIVAMSDVVLEKACKDMVHLSPDLVISVNISAVEFNTRGLAKRVKAALQKSGLKPSRLELEITENVTISNPDITLETMKQLKDIGVRFLIDDFGTGYSALSYLKRFPFDGIKLDKSYVFAMEESENAKIIVENIIGLGKAYSLAVTAEGVETAEQLKRLKQYHCDEAQGYFIGKPVALDALNLDVAFSV
ncbi:EAL domain-containing protein (plasmid) [Klebsiella pneumoniae]|uniref:bifunctional diguanylate cyclase/phosphodiesterase n=1 Tax=Klebsiella pneumoniae TaxID=573 RepID=UPI001430E52C|nr:EAL domain-containing protein [Klebsiella pneumoniae]QNU73950.1 EAL domain-containing protein [Klebsiella pneumoniae]